MLIRFNFTSIISIVLSLFYFGSSFAAIGQTYEEYLKEAWDYCDSTDRSWWKNNTLIPKIDYPKLSSDAINNTIKAWQNNPKWAIGDEKLRLKTDLDWVTIGEYSGFKALEVARIGYRSSMNSLFACAIIASRQKTIIEVQDVVNKKIKNKNSEILEKLKKEWKNLETTYWKLGCNETKDMEIITNLNNTIGLRYCHYRYYLGYLDSNLTAQLRDVQEIERRIGNWSWTQIAATTNEWTKLAPRYPSDLANEIIRADTTLPKAVATLLEMDQTYGAHLLLIFILDDYMKLRESLSRYMNVSSQLYQKAHNAQSTNK